MATELEFHCCSSNEQSRHYWFLHSNIFPQ